MMFPLRFRTEHLMATSSNMTNAIFVIIRHYKNTKFRKCKFKGFSLLFSWTLKNTDLKL